MVVRPQIIVPSGSTISNATVCSGGTLGTAVMVARGFTGGALCLGT
jgi:hypothetical protein